MSTSQEKEDNKVDCGDDKDRYQGSYQSRDRRATCRSHDCEVVTGSSQSSSLLLFPRSTRFIVDVDDDVVVVLLACEQNQLRIEGLSKGRRRGGRDKIGSGEKNN